MTKLLIFCYFLKAFLEDFEGPANVTVTVPLDQTDSSSVESTSVILVTDNPRKRAARFIGLLLVAIGLMFIGTIMVRDVRHNLYVCVVYVNTIIINYHFQL